MGGAAAEAASIATIKVMAELTNVSLAFLT
jgi:hypothetical protein